MLNYCQISCWECNWEEDIKESNTEKKKEEEHGYSDVNDRIYKQKKKGKLKANGGVFLQWMAHEIAGTWECLSVVQL